MTFLDLDKTQLKAVCKPVRGKSIVVAGAGSGKTRILIGRGIFTRIHADPDKIVLCTTFTNKAAEEIRTRLKKLVNLPEVKEAFKKMGREDKVRDHFWTGTLHSLALDMVRDLIEHYWHKLPEEEQTALDGFSPGLFTNLLGKDVGKALLSDAQADALWEECQENLRNTNQIPPKPSRAERTPSVVRSIWKVRACAMAEGIRIPPPIIDVKSDPSVFQIDKAILRDESRTANEYFLQKRERGLLDFDDFLILAGVMLRYSPTMKAHWAKHLAHLLLDEAQDLSSIDWYFIKSLPGYDDPDSDIGYTIIGDPRQEIFGFRGGATHDGMLWQMVNSGTWKKETIYLNTNYRSASSIVALAHRIAQNPRLNMGYEPDTERSSRSVEESGKGSVLWHLLSKKQDADSFLIELAEKTGEGTKVVMTPTNQQCAYIRDLFKSSDIHGFEVSTIHAAKGKEWDHVILTGLGAGRFPAPPSPWTTEAHNKREETRKLYVAVTRAKQSIEVMEPETGEFYPALQLVPKN